MKPVPLLLKSVIVFYKLRSCSVISWESVNFPT